MTNEFDKIKKTRLFLLDLVEELAVEQINEIPIGFNNNIIWNIGHLIAAQQGICYVRAGLNIIIDEKYFLPYKPGTKPEKYVDYQEVETIKELLISSIDKFEADYHQRLFSTYDAMTTRYGVELASIHDAIAFLPYHEGLHNGYIMALKRMIKK